MQAFGARHVEVGFIDRRHFHAWRERVQHFGNFGGAFFIAGHMAFHKNGMWAKLIGSAQWHGRMNAVFSGGVGSGRNHATGIGRATDNYGFAGWVELHAFELLSLGPGHHFGEWWGQGIQRGYDVPDKRWSMFWEPNHGERPGCVGIVPTLGTLESLADTIGLELILGGLRARGSQASPGFKRPEGVVVTHEVGFARRVADRVIMMDGGLIIEEAPPAVFFESPKHERTRKFLEAVH